MKKLIHAFILLLAFSFAATPAMAKDDSKPKSSTVKKASKSKKTTKKKTAKKSKDSKTRARKSNSSKDDNDSNSSSSRKSSSSTSSAKSSKKDSDKDSKSTQSSSRSSSSSRKKTVKSGLTGTDKAKQFKNITVNINKADADTLAYYLVGIGEERAKAIVKYRKKNGSFKSTGDLMQVPGIGEAIFAGLKKNVSTSRGESSVPKKSSTSSKK